MEYMLWIWLAITAMTAVVEFVTIQMVSAWFTLGGLCAIVAYAANAPYWAQIVVFILVSLISLLSFRKVAMKWILKNVNSKTNSDALIGRVVKLIDDITQDDPGAVKINDVVWSAVSENGEDIKAGNRVKILSIKGNKLFVEIDSSNQPPAEAEENENQDNQ